MLTAKWPGQVNIRKTKSDYHLKDSALASEELFSIYGLMSLKINDDHDSSAILHWYTNGTHKYFVSGIPIAVIVPLNNAILQ